MAPDVTRRRISRHHSKITHNRSLNSQKILFCDLSRLSLIGGTGSVVIEVPGSGVYSLFSLNLILKFIFNFLKINFIFQNELF